MLSESDEAPMLAADDRRAESILLAELMLLAGMLVRLRSAVVSDGEYSCTYLAIS